jgi:phosphohistidine phosphatase SixA
MQVARQLDDPKGIDEARTIGQALRQQAIPFSRVISSEYCRCRQTAQEMNLGPAIETSAQVTFNVYPEIEPCGAIRTQLSTAPASGTNTAIVAHVHPQCMMEMGLDLTLENGQAAIYRPNAMGNPTLIAKVRYNEWASLP